MSKNKKIIGKLGEDIACNFLQESGYQILNKNYKCHFGEIDIIARIEMCIRDRGDMTQRLNFLKLSLTKKKH